MLSRRSGGLGMLSMVVLVAVLGSWAIAQENGAPPATPAPDAPAAPATAATTQPAGGDLTGNWTWVVEGPGGEMEVLLKLKQEGEKLTGSMSGFGGEEFDIQDGTVGPDGQFSFKIVRDFGGQTMSSTYSGKIAGDALTGKMETVFSRGFEAKRQTEQPQPQPEEQPADAQPQEEQAPAQDEQAPAKEEPAPPAQEEPVAAPQE